jgi:hypothetical protein
MSRSVNASKKPSVKKTTAQKAFAAETTEARMDGTLVQKQVGAKIKSVFEKREWNHKTERSEITEIQLPDVEATEKNRRKK